MWEWVEERDEVRITKRRKDSITNSHFRPSHGRARKLLRYVLCLLGVNYHSEKR